MCKSVKKTYCVWLQVAALPPVRLIVGSFLAICNFIYCEIIVGFLFKWGRQKNQKRIVVARTSSVSMRQMENHRIFV